MNVFGPAIAHTVVSAQPGADGARVALEPTTNAEFANDFPDLQGLPTPRRLWRIAKAMRHFDLILCYNWGALDAVFAHRLYATVLGLPPLIHHEDGFNEDEADGLKTARNVFRRMALTSAKGLVVPSRRLATIALKTWRQPPTKVHLIGNGIDTEAYRQRPPVDALPGLIKSPGDKWVGTLAGLRAVKNLSRLVRAFAALPSDWRLVILGEGPDRSVIEAEALRCGIADRVHLPGFVRDPSRAVGLFDLFALSSDSEQFPISVVEAMATGLAIASPAVGDVADMVSIENRSYVTPPGDEAALAWAISELAHDPALREKIGIANRTRAQAEYDEETMIRSYRKIYGKAMGIGFLA